MSHPILNDAQAKMKKAVDHTLHEFSAIHTGKATPTMVETVTVEAYGSMMRLKECAAITTPDARLIQIQPWDVALTKAIAKGIKEANLGFNPDHRRQTHSHAAARHEPRTSPGIREDRATGSPKKAACTCAMFVATRSKP